MKTIITPRRAVFAAILATSVASFIACGGGGSNPSPSSSSTGAGGHPTIVGANSSSGPTTTSSSVGSTGSSGSTSTSTSASGSTSTSTGCVMNPMTNSDFLNQCNGMTCNHFDNTTRIPAWDGGALPPIM
jgi:hypothetical protein